MRAIVFSTGRGSVVPPLREALRKASWDLVKAANEQQLLALAREAVPDLIAIQSETQAGEALAIARRLRAAAGPVPLLPIAMALQVVDGSTSRDFNFGSGCQQAYTRLIRAISIELNSGGGDLRLLSRG